MTYLCLFSVSDNYEMPEGTRHHKPSVLWNAMIYPLKRMVLKGTIWYQGKILFGASVMMYLVCADF